MIPSDSSSSGGSSSASFLRSPFGDALVLDHAEEVASVEARILTVLEELAENLSTGGSRTAAEAAFGIEKLVIRCLEFVLQNGRLEDQQLSGIVVIFGAVRGIEQAELLPCLPSLIDKEIRQSRGETLRRSASARHRSGMKKPFAHRLLSWEKRPS